MPFHQLHPDIGMNFQINRVLTYGEQAGNLEEIQAIVPRIHDFETWYTEWTNLAINAEKERRCLHAAFGYRMAEFFLTDDRPEKMLSYESFIRCFYQAIDQTNIECLDIPYDGRTLPAIRFQAPNEKGVIVVHGGYDSFIEEFYLTVKQLPSMGYTIILFEGPGQGAALKRQGFKFTHEWEKPVGAILDHFNLNQATLLGISWGGYLALRAAAFDKRIERVIAYDVCFDGLDVMTRPIPTPIRQIVRLLIQTNSQGFGNVLVQRMMKRSLLLDWAVTHGMYITGSQAPIDFYRQLALHTMRSISSRVDQDVLLLAGEKDHYIPLHQFHQQRNALINARSLKSRLFTVAEGGEQHCQVGNHQLAVDEMISWLDSFSD